MLLPRKFSVQSGFAAAWLPRLAHAELALVWGPDMKIRIRTLEIQMQVAVWIDSPRHNGLEPRVPSGLSASLAFAVFGLRTRTLKDQERFHEGP